MFIRIIITLAIVCSLMGYGFAQNGSGIYDSKKASLSTSPLNVNTPLSSSKFPVISNIDPPIKEDEARIKVLLLDQYTSGRRYFQPQKEVKPPDIKSKLVSSFRENIRVGLRHHYAVVNFTPAMSIKPFDFMTIDANQNLSCYVPIKGIKEHYGALLVHGAAILVIDNSVKLLDRPGHIVRTVAGFILKNIVTTILKLYIDKPSSNKIYTYNNYYYSIKITF